MESPQSQKMVAHWDLEPPGLVGRRVPRSRWALIEGPIGSVRIPRPTLRFMESFDDLSITLWDHEPKLGSAVRAANRPRSQRDRCHQFLSFLEVGFSGIRIRLRGNRPPPGCAKNAQAQQAAVRKKCAIPTRRSAFEFRPGAGPGGGSRLKP